jgi:protocatechuate 4,5-dioxygenase alpha chain
MSEEIGSQIPGTTVFTGERSRQGYRLNRMANSLSDPANRERFLADEPAYMAAMGLGEAEQQAVRRRDSASLLARGGNIYLLLRIATTVGQSIPDMQQQMRGEN